jgi:diamine N-acetyltransferase
VTDIKPLERRHVGPLYRLTLLPEQNQFVAPNGVTMAEAPFEPGSEVYGLWSGETAVGLVALIDFGHPDAILLDGDDPTGLYVWRLFVDQRFQGQGHGTTALNFSKARMKELARSALFITALDEPGSAIPLYEREGFVRTGRIVEGETELVWRG